MLASFKTPRPPLLVLLLVALCLLAPTANASLGDRLPEFRECVHVCERENCDPNNNPTHIPLHRRLLFWTCPQECDYTCQHIVSQRRAVTGQHVTQFHGKWPFVRVMGIQEPFSVLFSLGNLVAHQHGLAKIRANIPKSYSLRPYYVMFAWVGSISWVFSTIFHCRDFRVTEELDYFAAGASVLYGMYYAPVRVFRLDKPTRRRRSVLRLWTIICVLLYVAHVSYLKLWAWNYSYNMAANVTAGLIQNSLWTYFSILKWRESHTSWAAWPGLIVMWIMLAMSLELLDFPPVLGLDAHSLWHLGTIGPAVMWYNFMVKDSSDDISKNLKDIKSKA